MEMYLIALKYKMRDEMSLVDAIARIRDIPGLKTLGDPAEEKIVRVSIPEEWIPEVEDRIARWCHIERSIEHYPQSTT